jgi:hypothetical protein
MYPDIITTAVVGQMLAILLTNSGPHISGMMTSDTTKSKHGMACAISNACVGWDAAWTS